MRLLRLTKTIGFAAVLPLALSIGCANGGTGTGPGGGTTSSSSTGGGGTGGETGGSGGSGASTTSTGGMGGTTTSSTSSTTSSTTSTTSTSTGMTCTEPAASAGYGLEAESNANIVTATPLAADDKGWTASLCPAGDIDVFKFEVTTAGLSLKLEINGPGGTSCPSGAQTYLRLFDSNNVLIAEDSGGGIAGCSMIAPATHPPVTSLAVGTYYAQVESLLFSSINAYTLSVAGQAPACGDGLVQTPAGEQCDDGNTAAGDGCDDMCLVEAVCGDGTAHAVAGEQCDDGNTAAGDGCSDLCQLEANLTQEVEPNTQANPTSLVGFDGAFGAINPEGDADWFSFEVTVPGSSVVISTSDGLSGCPMGVDTVVYLYNSANTLLASDDEDGEGSCSLIAPGMDAAASNLPAGTYKIKVEDYLNNDTITSYVLLVNVGAPGCGDLVVQVGEQCDDGNNNTGDGCSDTCQFEANYTTETEPNPLANPNSINGFDGVIGAINPAGEVDVFSFDITVPGSSVVIETSDGLNGCPAFDSVIKLYNPGGMLLVTDDEGGVDSCSRIDPTAYPAVANLPAGTYKIEVSEFLNDETSALYVLKVKVNPPGCGDGLLNAGEQCDDGNTTAGDGCSDLCLAEAPWEVEPNDAQPNATPLWPGFNTWQGVIPLSGDVDWFKFNVAAGQTVTIAGHNINAPMACSFDFKISLWNGGGTELINDDDDGVGLCPLINPMLDPQAGTLPAGAYYILVEPVTGTGSYQLDLTVQ
ncbi:MAG: pre-peptidase C-terminal domain-containing protein [Polyangiaceae bacterium]|nr:pre-peptidase C-terminal domain-containing protein [Polyangiaceae bacterium]